MEIPMPKSVLNCTLTSTQGKYAFDPVSKILTWEVGKIDGQKLPNIRGSVSILIISCPIKGAKRGIGSFILVVNIFVNTYIDSLPS